MSYPYLSDYINSIFNTQLNLPIATFGSFVAIAILLGSYVGVMEVKRYEKLSLLPKNTYKIVSDLTIISALSGIVGARIFHILEYPSEFLNDPIGMIFSKAGLSIYGGFILGTISGIIYLKKKSTPITPMLDALAPSLALGYGIGRIGCQVSGDGDWGIKSDLLLKPNWIPEWFWSSTYENNIAGIFIEKPGVYPTPIYETLTALLIFIVLWLARKHSHLTGLLISVYLLLSGFSRLLIEKIRINSEYSVMGFNFTQAEFISTIFIMIGLFGIIKTAKLRSFSKIIFSFTIMGLLTACSNL